MTSRLDIQTTLSGPFFAAQPRRVVGANVRDMLGDAVTEGADVVRAELRAGLTLRAPVRILGDRVADHVRGRVKSLGGHPWSSTGLVSVSIAGTVGDARVALMAAASGLESRRHAFRRAPAAMLRELRADRLLDGLD